MATSLEEKLWIQTSKTQLEKIDLVSHPICVEGLVNNKIKAAI